MATGTAGSRRVAHPLDDVLAVIDDEGSADDAKRALGHAGFAEADIHVFRGRDEMLELARSWWKHSGVPPFLAPFLAAMLTQVGDVAAVYESAGLAGHTVLAIHTRSRADVERARRVLRENGAHDAWYFGRWTLAPLERSTPRRTTG